MYYLGLGVCDANLGQTHLLANMSHCLKGEETNLINESIHKFCLAFKLHSAEIAAVVFGCVFLLSFSISI